MGRHSQPDRGDRGDRAPESRATGEPAWEHWWEKTGGQPRIVDPPIDDRPSRPPLAGLPPPAAAPQPPPAGLREVEPLTHPGANGGGRGQPGPRGGGVLGPATGAGPVVGFAADPSAALSGRLSGPGLPPLRGANPGPASGSIPVVGSAAGPSAAQSGPPSGPGLPPLRGADPGPRTGSTPVVGFSADPGSGPGTRLSRGVLPPPSGSSLPPPRPGPASTGPVGLSSAFPLEPEEPPAGGRPLRSVSGSREAGRSGRGTNRRAAQSRGAPAHPTSYGGTGAATAAAPLPYDTSPGLPADRGRAARPTSATAILPAPGILPSRSAPAPAETTGTRPAVRAVPDPDTGTGVAVPAGPVRGPLPGGPLRGDSVPTGGAAPGAHTAALPSPARSGRAGRPGRASRGRREDPHAEAAERDVPLPTRTAPAPEPVEHRPARALRAVDADSGEDTGIHYGFEDEPSLMLQWGGFLLQTLLGAGCGLGIWLGFYQLWQRWPFYAAPAAGAAMAIMLTVTRTIRRRYGHDLDLLTATLTVGVGVVLTVLPAAFVLQHV